VGSKVDKSKAYSWVAYMLTHQPEEMAKLLRYGTPSDRLIKIAEQPFIMTLSDGRRIPVFFPESLNKSSGQKLLYTTAKAVSQYIRTAPIQAFYLYEDIKKNFVVRRKDTRENYLQVAEAVCHRAASEYKHEVLFSFDSIIAWVKSVYGKELGYVTIRRALETLEAQNFLRVNEWGRRGIRNRATKIELITHPKEYILTYTSKIDSWLDSAVHGMMAVYRRESTTRQDVLEAQIHHYAEQVVNEDSRYAEGRRLFASVTTEKELEDETTNIDRLLGELVSTMQEAEPDSGRISTEFLRLLESTKNRC